MAKAWVIPISEELNKEAFEEAHKLRVSKSEFVRQAVKEQPRVFPQARPFCESRLWYVCPWVILIHGIDDVVYISPKELAYYEILVCQCEICIPVAVGEKLGELCLDIIQPYCLDSELPEQGF